MSTRAITVLKIGGSLARSDAASRLMRALSARPVRNLVIVPGGGAFADAVRAAQAQDGLSEHAAHHMALLAMHMMAVALQDQAPGFVLAASVRELEAAWRDGTMPIWLPAPMVLADERIPASWSVTSDSLAVWLAGEISAARLVLAKSCTLPARAEDAFALSEAGVVDEAFTQFAQGHAFQLLAVSGVEAALKALW